MFSSDVLVQLIWFMRFSYGICKCSYLKCFVVLREDDICLIVFLTCFFHQLEAMGFDRATVLEVFFACNKNEELAANYLLDHMHEFEDWFNKISMVYFLLAASPNIHSTKKYITSLLFSVTSFLNASSSTFQSGIYMMCLCMGWTEECLGVFGFRITLVSPLLGFIKILLYIVACLGICFHCVYLTSF